MSLLDQILNYERQNIAEVHLLLDLGVFPASEIAVSRRELQILRDSLDSDRKTALPLDDNEYSNVDGSTTQRDPAILFACIEQELQITEKKNMLLKGRRMDAQRDMAAAGVVDMLYSVETPDNIKHASSSGGGGPPRRATRNVNRF